MVAPFIDLCSPTACLLAWGRSPALWPLGTRGPVQPPLRCLLPGTRAASLHPGAVAQGTVRVRVRRSILPNPSPGMRSGGRQFAIPQGLLVCLGLGSGPFKGEMADWTSSPLLTLSSHMGPTAGQRGNPPLLGHAHAPSHRPGPQDLKSVHTPQISPCLRERAVK